MFCNIYLLPVFDFYNVNRQNTNHSSDILKSKASANQNRLQPNLLYPDLLVRHRKCSGIFH